MSGILDFIRDSEVFIDLYLILEIEMDAEISEIKTAYITLAKKNHPDQGGSSELFQQITRAYEILYNKELRKEYDLYYLKKSMDEFKGDDMIRLREEYKNFMSSNIKPISKEEIDKIYDETFNEYKDNYIESKIENEIFDKRINDIELERENMNIDTSDDSLINFIKKNHKDINLNDFFEYIKYKNSNYFDNNIVTTDIGTLDTLPGYSNNFASFIDENENCIESNYYSDLSNINNSPKELLNLDFDDYKQWKSINNINNTKLSSLEIDSYLEKRNKESNNFYKEVIEGLHNSTKRKEVKNFLKTKHLSEDINKYYDNNNNENSNNNLEIKNDLEINHFISEKEIKDNVRKREFK